MKVINDYRIFKSPVFRSTNIDINTPEIEIKRKFDRDGYVTIPKVIDSQRVIELRNYLDGVFKSGKEPNTKDFFSNPSLYTIPFQDKVINALKLLLGEEAIVLYPNFNVRKNVFTDWHIDGAFVGTDDLLQSNNFKHVQCILYLQKNTEQMGGGLDVVPRSHHLLFNRFKNNNKISNWLVTYRNRRYEPVSIDYELGDLIVFHSKLIHRGTQNKSGANLENSKYGIFWAASKDDNAHLSRHRHFFNKTYRELAELTNTGEKMDTLEQYKILKTQLRLKNVLNFKFPNDYPAEIRNLVSKHKINIADL
jgi:hypothetical protein